MISSRKQATNVYLGMGILIIGIIAYVAVASQQEKPNPETNCYKHISGKMAILIDKTDIIPPQTQTKLLLVH
jgi:hypothetical protein